jgi:hypothetical protein
VKRPNMSHEQRVRLARELVLAIQSLHLAGIVHGAIHGGNVIVDDRGEVWLVDVSPLLWTDEQADVDAVITLLAEFFQGDAEVSGALTDGARPMTLSGVMDLLSATRDEQVVHAQDERARARALALAGLTIAVGVAVTVAVWRYVANPPPPPAQAATTR